MTCIPQNKGGKEEQKDMNSLFKESIVCSPPPPSTMYHRYRGVSTSGKGDLVVGGMQLGNVFLGVQPLLGLEGDPMRLMFERDLTPHPQYAAFYEWVKGEQGFGAQVSLM